MSETNQRVMLHRARSRVRRSLESYSQRGYGMAAQEEMNCKELVELVTDYLEGALPPADRTRFEVHLKECPGCETYLDQMRQTVRTLGTLKEDSVPAAARAALLETFRNWKHTRQS